MSQAEKGFLCFCERSEANARTFKDLENLVEVTHLEADLETVALLGTQLENSLVSTNNGAALIKGLGCFASYEGNGMFYSVSEKRIKLHVSPKTPLQIIRA